MPKLTPRELAALHEQHRPRAQMRHEIDLALIAVGSCTYDLSVWSGRENWMEMTSQQKRDEAGPAGLAKLDAALKELTDARNKLAAMLDEPQAAQS